MSQRYIGGLIYNPPGGFSGYFDGTGDTLNTPATTAFDFANNNFTIEAWIYTTSFATPQGICANQDNGGAGALDGWVFGVGTDGSLQFQDWTNGSTVLSILSAANTIALNTWQHVVVEKRGTGTNQIQLFVSGVAVASGTRNANIPVSTSNQPFTVGNWRFSGDTNREFTGYISNLRIVNAAVYNGTVVVPSGPLQAITNTSLLTCAYPTFRDGSTNNFTITVNGNTAVSTQNPFPLTTLPNPALGNAGNGLYTLTQYQSLRSQNLWPALDQYFDYVTLLLHGNGTNGAQNNTFLDSSTNNFTITRNGNTTQGAFSPYGENWSNYFDGTGDFLSVPDNAAYDFGTGAFTVEAWVYHTVSSGASQVYFSHPTGGIGVSRNNAGALLISQSGTADITSAGSIPLNAWTHVAVSRTGTTMRLFVNGALVSTVTNSTNFNGNTAPQIGAAGGALFMNGYISNLRVITGAAQYTAEFTPPTAPLTAITNTSLLTCQSNRFIDNSSNNFTITRNGDVSVQKFSPFNPTAAYNPAVVGASGYFDGATDWLSAGAASNWTFLHNGASDWTIQFWVYHTGTSLYGVLSTTAFSAQVGMSVLLNNTNSGGVVNGVQIYIARGVNGSDIAFNSSAALVTNAWNYVAITFTSSTKTCAFTINGTTAGSSSNTGFAYSSSAPSNTLSIGRFDGTTPGGYLPGYLADTRISNTVRSSLTTVPSAPLASDGNTNLLLSFTNAGVIDNSALNNLETVGNAQISTVQSRFGGASLAFDGNTDCLYAPNTPQLQFLTGDYTVEFWVNPTNFTGTPVLVDFRTANGASGGGLQFSITTGGLVQVYGGSTTATLLVIAGSALSTGTFAHIALTRNGTSTRLFINGVQSGSTATDSTSYGLGAFWCGANAGNGSNYFNGYIDDLRITKGIARYVANFTPQRSQWQDQ